MLVAGDRANERTHDWNRVEAGLDLGQLGPGGGRAAGDTQIEPGRGQGDRLEDGKTGPTAGMEGHRTRLGHRSRGDLAIDDEFHPNFAHRGHEANAGGLLHGPPAMNGPAEDKIIHRAVGDGGLWQHPFDEATVDCDPHVRGQIVVRRRPGQLTGKRTRRQGDGVEGRLHGGGIGHRTGSLVAFQKHEQPAGLVSHAPASQHHGHVT